MLHTHKVAQEGLVEVVLQVNLDMVVMELLVVLTDQMDKVYHMVVLDKAPPQENLEKLLETFTLEVVEVEHPTGDIFLVLQVEKAVELMALLSLKVNRRQEKMLSPTLVEVEVAADVMDVMVAKVVLVF